MAFIAMALAIVLMPVAAYAVDIATVSSAAATLQEATAVAAMEAAQQLNTAAFRSSGVLVIDMNAAHSTARAVLAAEAPSASLSSINVSGVEVTIEAGQLVRLPFDFGAPDGGLRQSEQLLTEHVGKRFERNPIAVEAAGRAAKRPRGIEVGHV